MCAIYAGNILKLENWYIHMEYKETVRSIPDNLVADIYKKEITNIFVINFYVISGFGKHFVLRKVRSLLNGKDYQTIKNKIRESLFQEVHRKAYNPVPMDSMMILPHKFFFIKIIFFSPLIYYFSISIIMNFFQCFPRIIVYYL